MEHPSPPDTKKMTEELPLTVEKDSKAKPFLKWVGGKSQLLPELLFRLPSEFERYIEPFIGGGALYFAIGPEDALISDINEELITTYRVIKNDLPSLTKELENHVYEKEHFYRVREADRKKDYEQWSDVSRAARFIFLNKTCFNGLYRVNSKGQFNAPFGRYSNPKILDKANLLACSKALDSATILNGCFQETISRAKSGDFVYFDPPYVPLNDTSYFTSYSRSGFGRNEQMSLAKACASLDRLGVQFMLSNSATDFVRELYSGFRIETIQARRAINSNAARRGKIEELVIRNY